MVQLIRVRFYGSFEACEKAKAILDNQPQIKRIVSDEKTGELSVILNARLRECDMVPMLKDSGIAAFRIRR